SQREHSAGAGGRAGGCFCGTSPERGIRRGVYAAIGTRLDLYRGADAGFHRPGGRRGRRGDRPRSHAPGDSRDVDRRPPAGAATSMPEVSHATLQETVPFMGMSSWPLVVAGVDSVSKFGQFEAQMVSSDYFATMGTRLLRGRGVAERDRDGAPRVMVVGQAM